MFIKKFYGSNGFSELLNPTGVFKRLIRLDLDISSFSNKFYLKALCSILYDYFSSSSFYSC
jgi:hypothetical protein